MIKRELLANYPREDKELKEKNKIAKKLDKNKKLQRNLIKAYMKGENYYKFSISGGNSAMADFVEEYFETLGYKCKAIYWYSLKEMEVVVRF